jgi:hypothetical protein
MAFTYYLFKKILMAISTLIFYLDSKVGHIIIVVGLIESSLGHPY